MSLIKSNDSLLEKSKFVPNEIASYVKKNYTIYQIKNIKEGKWNIYVYGNSILTIKKEINDFVKKIQEIVSYLYNYGFTSLSKLFDRKIDFHYYPTKFKKKIPKSKEKIQYQHVNSAYTEKKYEQGNDKCSNFNVVIFRKEEIERTIIHELIHSLEIHCAFFGGTIIPDSKEKECLKNHSSYGLLCDNFRKKPKILEFDEAIVETWTTLIHCHIKRRSFNEEVRYSIFQSAKIIKLLGYKTCEEFY